MIARGESSSAGLERDDSSVSVVCETLRSSVTEEASNEGRVGTDTSSVWVELSQAGEALEWLVGASTVLVETLRGRGDSVVTVVGEMLRLDLAEEALKEGRVGTGTGRVLGEVTREKEEEDWLLTAARSIPRSDSISAEV